MIAKVALGLTGAVLGLGLGLFVSGCGDECNCPTPGEIGRGTFPVIGLNTRPGQSAPPFELEAATVTIGDETVAVRYSRAGGQVSVTYPVLRKYGHTP
ncbi:MAG TPA: hypothetical protein VER33_25125 [Polyangiaceae bacterium]|nr:hypothetical protein [Polyangiaceae bacterium]